MQRYGEKHHSAIPKCWYIDGIPKIPYICPIMLIFENYMKRIFVFLAAMISLVSCFSDEPMNSQSYTLTSTFEYTNVKFDSDSTFFDTTYGEGLGWYDLVFNHKVDIDYGLFHGGFRLSCLKASDEEGADGTWRVVLGESGTGAAGMASSANYLVWYSNPDQTRMPEHDIRFANKAYGTCTPAGFYINNTASVAAAVKEKFTLGDRLTLKATGWLGTEKTGEAEIALADFSAEKDSVVTAWTAFDLSGLGSVEYIDLEMVSTKEGIPGYFCMDNMIASINLKY